MSSMADISTEHYVVRTSVEITNISYENKG